MKNSNGLVSVPARAGVVIGVVVGLAGGALGADFDWKAAANGNWSDRAKWALNQVPNSTLPDNSVEIKKAGAFTVTVDGSFGCFDLNFDSPMATLEIPAGNELRFNSQHGNSTGLNFNQGTVKLDGGRLYGFGNNSKKVNVAAAVTLDVTKDSSMRAYVSSAGTWNVKANLNVGRVSTDMTQAGQFVNTGTVDIAAGKSLTVENTTAADAFFDHQKGTLKGKGSLTVKSTDAKGKVKATKTTDDVTKVKPGTSLTPSRGGSPDFEPGTLTIDADYEQGAGVILDIALGGTIGSHGSEGAGITYSNLSVLGTTMLGGSLQLDLLPGFQSQVGEFFDVMTMASFPNVNTITLDSAPVFLGTGGESLTFRLLDELQIVEGGYALRVEVIDAIVPTPGAAALMMASGLAVLRRRR